VAVFTAVSAIDGIESMLGSRAARFGVHKLIVGRPDASIQDVDMDTSAYRKCDTLCQQRPSMSAEQHF
jgi:hypothetical protein